MSASVLRIPALLFSVLGLAWATPGPAAAQALPGDLDGDGVVSSSDEPWLQSLYGSAAGDDTYDPAADLNGDGAIDLRDLGLFGAAFGTGGGDVDTTPPEIFITLNDVPDDQNDLLVVPPEGFQITVGLDSAGSSVIDKNSIAITATQEIGGIAPGNDLGPIFAVSPTRLFYQVPPGADLPRTTFYLAVSALDAAGNPAVAIYGFAVRDFGFGPPLGTLQTVFLDFDQDRSLGPEVDFLEDLREYGLSSPLDPTLEAVMRGRAVDEAIERTRALYGRNPDGSPGADPVNVDFTTSAPGGSHARLCVGGQSSLGGAYLGATALDPENLVTTEDTCSGTQLGVFPAAMDNLWGSQASFQNVFGSFDADLGGTPIGEHPLDPVVLDPGFDLGTATQAELDRYFRIEVAVQVFGSVLGTIIAHETGHLVGLVAHGPTPGGLFGGAAGAKTDHNVTPSGAHPAVNWVMNAGSTFSFDEIAGLNGQPLPTFRPLAQAYLRNRVALNQQVTGLYPAPTLSQVTPNPAVYPAGQYTTPITIDGSGFFGAPFVDVLLEGSPTWDPVQNVTWVSDTTLTGTINAYIVIPGLYDVRVTNPDGQAVVLENHLLVEQE